MTQKQPEALRLADALKDYKSAINHATVSVEAATELRRLHALNADLLEALKAIEARITYYAGLAEGDAPNIEQWAYTDQSGDLASARAAIAKAEGEQA